MTEHSEALAMTPDQVAKVYPALSATYLEKLRLRGGGPAYSKPSARRVIYMRADIEAWLASTRRHSTSEGC